MLPSRVHEDDLSKLWYWFPTLVYFDLDVFTDIDPFESYNWLVLVAEASYINLIIYDIYFPIRFVFLLYTSQQLEV